MAVTSETDFMSRVKEQTWPLHQQAEGRPLEQALIKGELPRPLYVKYLEQRYLIHRALENHVRRLAQQHPALQQMIREELFQEANLVVDLQHLGSKVDQIAPGRATLAFLSEMEALLKGEPLALLGSYYVFEGSKNGGRYIARSVSRAFQLPPGPGLRYLDPHGEQQRELWARFRTGMNQLDLTPPQQDAIIAAAKRTFELVSQLDDELYMGA